MSDKESNNKDSTISTWFIKLTSDNSEVSKKIKERITTLYESEIPFAAVWDINTENLRAKIINSHINLEKSINTLEKTIEVSRKVCKSQDGSKWDCN